MSQYLAQIESPSFDSELNRTQSPKETRLDFFWKQDIFNHIGYMSINMVATLSKLAPAQKESFRQAILDFSVKGDYAASGIRSIFSALNIFYKYTLSDIERVTRISTIPSLQIQIGALKNFFIFWKARDLHAITDEALQLLLKARNYSAHSRNILSDDPEKSWLSDNEYEALLASVWRNYEDNLFTAGHTLMMLLSMQYARRPIQFSHLKIKDFRIATLGDSSGLSGKMVSFPGVKDMNSETGFRDSKFEHHPLPDHLWNLFKIQRNEIRAMLEPLFGTRLTDSDIDQLPVFTTENRIEKAIFWLTDHYRVNWRTFLDHHLFHITASEVSKSLNSKCYGRLGIEPPLSHRTDRPIVVNATRMRHTRARQLARKGVPLHVLSHWLGHTTEHSIRAYYNDPAEDARKLDEAMAPALMPLAMAFAGNLIDSEDQASRRNDPASRLEFAKEGELKNVGNCGKHTFCATTSVPIPCYRCRHFEPLVSAHHEEVLEALNIRQQEENLALRIGGARNLLVPIDLSADIIAVQNCINRCIARKIELGIA